VKKTRRDDDTRRPTLHGDGLCGSRDLRLVGDVRFDEAPTLVCRPVERLASAETDQPVIAVLSRQFSQQGGAYAASGSNYDSEVSSALSHRTG
jgi:hypothetical protein